MVERLARMEQPGDGGNGGLGVVKEMRVRCVPERDRWIREQRLAGLAIDNMTTPETPNLTFKTARDAIARFA